MVASDSLPVKVFYRNAHPTKEELEANYTRLREMGFELSKPFDDDPLFMPVILPEGWKRKGCDHNMWSHILDDKGRQRLSIFYKAAYYDRRSFANLLERVTVENDWTEMEKRAGGEGKIDRDVDIHTVFAKQAGEEKHVLARFVGLIENFRNREQMQENVLGIAQSWAKENYPDHENPAAYWDLELKEQS